MCTPVYIKADPHEQLLLSEGVCRQLGILQYHPEVEPWRGGRKRSKRSKTQTHTGTSVPRLREQNTDTTGIRTTTAEQMAKVPTVRVRLVQFVRLLSHQGASVHVKLDPGTRLHESDADSEPNIKTNETTADVAGSTRYSLRKRITVPKRLVVKTHLRSSSPRGRGDVTD